MPVVTMHPSMLFVGASDGAERSFLRPLLAKLRSAGYTRYVEPCVGTFATVQVAEAAGFTPAQIDTSDVSLYTSILGYLLAGRDLASLDMRVDGAPVDTSGPPVVAAARMLYTQLVARIEARPDNEYWAAMHHDTLERAEEHTHAILEKLEVLNARSAGLTYRAVDLWDHLAEAAADPHTVVSVYPPTKLRGYETFYETGGRVTWAEPAYSTFTLPDSHVRLQTMFADAPALLLVSQQTEPGHAAHPTPVYARHVAAGQYVYVLSNRPTEVFGHTGGPKVAPRRMVDTIPLPYPQIPQDYEIRPDSQITVIACPMASADYYRDLWLHRVKGGGREVSGYAILVDGFLAGVGGHSLQFVKSGSTNPLKDAALAVFALGAPHKDRLTRLIVMVSLQAVSLATAFGPSASIHRDLVGRVITFNFTRHPEAKQMRGLMKLEERKDHEDGYKLTYVAPLGHQTPEDCLHRWLTDEARWQKSRAKP